MRDLSDDELVAAAYDQFWTTFGEDESISPVVRVRLLEDLGEAAALLQRQSVLSMEARGRLRSFVLNARLRTPDTSR
jgi:hypothetical protein